MKHYEFSILFHPNQSERVSEMLERYASQIKDQYGGRYTEYKILSVRSYITQLSLRAHLKRILQ